MKNVSKSFIINGGTMKKIIVLVLTLTAGLSYAKNIVVPYTLADRDRIIRIEAHQVGMDKRFDDMNRKIDMLSYIFGGIVVFLIGYTIWDRRTMLKPFEEKTKSIEAIAKSGDEKYNKIFEVFRELAKDDKKVANVLGRFNLL